MQGQIHNNPEHNRQKHTRHPSTVSKYPAVKRCWRILVLQVSELGLPRRHVLARPLLNLLHAAL